MSPYGTNATTLYAINVLLSTIISFDCPFELFYLPLTFEVLNVLVVGTQGHIQVVKSIWQVELIVIARDGIGHHADPKLFISGYKPTPNALLVVVE